MLNSWDKTDRQVAVKATRTGDNPRAAWPKACALFHSQFSPIPLIGQSTLEFIFNRIPREADGTSARDDDKISGRRKNGTASAKKFTDLSLDSIPNDRIADFAADSDPQPGLILVVRRADNHEISGVNLAAGARQF